MAETREISIEYTRLSEIQVDPDNAKDHDLGALSESLARFGFVAPMGVNENTGQLLWGHGRLAELQQLKASHDFPPDGISVADDGEWLAPVIRGIQLSEQDGKAYVIADNRLVELGGWNERQLIENLINIGGQDGAGLGGTGYDGQDLDSLIIMHGNPPNLDDLEQEWGDPEDKNFWPIIRLQVSPSTYRDYIELVSRFAGADEGEQFTQLLKEIRAAVEG